MITKFERIESAKNITKTKILVFDDVDNEVDEFEREDEQRQRALDDYGIVEEPESDVALEVDMRKQEFGTDPDELRPMLNMSVNPDYSDPGIAEVIGRSASEVICPTEHLWVARNYECVCGDIHR